jgi:hypothetical protein
MLCEALLHDPWPAGCRAGLHGQRMEADVAPAGQMNYPGCSHLIRYFMIRGGDLTRDILRHFPSFT